jgi:peptide/nickel transport system permease protein
MENQTEQTLKDNRPADPEAQIFLASQWKLMWWKFTRHKLAMAGAVVVILGYLTALFAEFLAPYDPNQVSIKYQLSPPSLIRVRDTEGRWHPPFVYDLQRSLDLEQMQLSFKPDTTRRHPVKLLARGHSYKLWGLFRSDRHLFGVESGAEWHPLGTDRMGRDILSRVIYGTRISLSIGLIGVFLSLFLGVTIGGFSGYFGGLFDTVTQRVIELLRSIPSLPLWLALSAALPPGWPPLRIYFGITIILSLIGWTNMARIVRGKFLTLREEDFVMAARLCGAGKSRIVFYHMVPSFLSHIIASVTLAIPGMIIGETSMSFLGVGLRPPVISWGVLLQEGQNIQSIALSPWVLSPGIFVVITVLAFNFLGDGLRDAADPYSSI